MTDWHVYGFDVLLLMLNALQMVVEFAEPCNSCCVRPEVVQSELDAFVRSFQQLSNKQLSSALKISRIDILNQVSQLVPCVGCRHRLRTLLHWTILPNYSQLPASRQGQGYSDDWWAVLYICPCMYVTILRGWSVFVKIAIILKTVCHNVI